MEMPSAMYVPEEVRRIISPSPCCKAQSTQLSKVDDVDPLICTMNMHSLTHQHFDVLSDTLHHFMHVLRDTD